MFSVNNIISKSQYVKMYFTISIASSVLLLLYDYPSVYEGIFTILLSYILATILILVYSQYLIYKNSRYLIHKESSDYIPKKKYKFLGKIFSILLIIKYCFILLICTYLLGFCISNILNIPSYNLIYMSALTILVIYIERSTIEQFARFGELIFYIVLIPIVITLLSTTPYVSFTTLAHAFSHESISDISILRIIIIAIILTKILFPLEIISDMSSHLQSPTKDSIHALRRRSILSLSIIMIIVLAFTVITLGIFGCISTDYTIHPLFSIMQMIRLNNIFEGRLEGIVCIFIFSSLIYQSSYYLKALGKTTKEKLRLPFSAYYLYIPIVIVGTLIIPNIRDVANTSSPEERLVVKNIYISENKSISIEVFDITSDTIRYETPLTSLTELETAFIEEYDMYLDFSHTNNIYVSEYIFNDTTLLRNILASYKKDLRFPETLLVINSDHIDTSIMLYKLFIP